MTSTDPELKIDQELSLTQIHKAEEKISIQSEGSAFSPVLRKPIAERANPF